jgi:lipoprotein-anchoring transpeptidase ErfK/SrfK
MRDGTRHNAATAIAVLLAGQLALSACAIADEGKAARPGPDGASAGSAAITGKDVDISAADISITPDDTADNVGINDDVQVTVENGTVEQASMTAVETGEEIAGSLSGDRTGWQPDGSHERATRYQLEVRAADDEGRVAHEDITFTTVSPDDSFIAYFTPEDEATVGVGMPESLNFDKKIEDKAAVESAVRVNTSSGQEVAGHWFGDDRLDFRPEDYWAAGSEITVSLELDGLEASPGVTGVQDRTFTFTVGRSQISTVDVETKRMTVVRDGRSLRTVPISAGSERNPTYNGQMVISEKHEETRMNGASVGFTDGDGKGEYDIKDVPHALRLSSSGTFIHGNYWTEESVFGSENTSHGCVGLADVKGADDPTRDGAWFYDNSLLGDVVRVVNSPDDEMRPDNGLNVWNMPWSEWRQGSALPASSRGW